MKKENYKKVECKICGAAVHIIEAHLKEAKHEVVKIEDYMAKYPDAPIVSEAAKTRLLEIQGAVMADKVDFDIRKTFGISLSADVKTIKGFANPKKTTPEIDADYVFDRKILTIIAFALSGEKENVLLTGATGSGKSSVIEQVVARLNLPYYRINFDGDITRSDIIGQWTLKGEAMEFQYGILPRAMMEGAVLCLDEWDCINPAIGMILQPVLEGKSLIITETGDIIKPHEDFRIFATSNTIGQGDQTGLYNGTQPQNFAQLDRFTLVGIVDYPTEKVEKKILAKKAGIVDEDLVKKILTVATLIRKSFIKGETVATMSTRTIVNIGQKLVAFGDVKAAYAFTFLNKLNAEDKVFASEIIQRVFGGVVTAETTMEELEDSEQ